MSESTEKDDTTPVVDESKAETTKAEEPKLVEEESVMSSPPTIASPTHSEGSDNSAVLVDHEDAGEEPRALQIVSIGTEEDSYAFTYQKGKMESIISRIPEGTKVSVVSVVGAFRTGKSFVLSFFLRYLHHLEQQEKNGGNNSNSSSDGTKWYDAAGSLGNDGFHWKAGSDRNTTGIWMWSQPYLVNGVAVLLVDTQGMFDNETTMSLTASIFGLSTLLSSYQIYNVDKMIGEDALQQLSLFTEYARAAMTSKQEKEGDKPFQKVEFLVRDWQHFEEEEDVVEMAREMDLVLEKVMADRDAKDLKETREQINMCFDKVSIYGLTHPGFAVTKKTYAGDISKIEPTFLKLLDQYCPRVFDNLAPKKIHGRELTGEELASFIESYAKLFASGASFPEASTMLEATAGANNTNATNLAIKAYKENMDRVAGPQCSNYVRSEELINEHKENVARTLEVFSSIANFGSKRSIDDSKRNLMQKIGSDFEVYEKLNDGRNPLLGMEIYLIPLAVALGSYIVRLLFDWTCAPWSQMCKNSSDLLSHVYAVVLFFLVIVASTKAKQIGDFVTRLKTMLEAMNNGGAAAPARGGPKSKAD